MIGIEEENARMGKSEFEIVMSEIDAIAEKVNAFPRYMQEPVFRYLVDTLLDRHDHEETYISGKSRSSVARAAAMRKGRYSSIEIDRSKLRSYYSRHDLGKINDMEFAAFCAYYLTELASEEARRKSVDETILLEMCDIVGRAAPGNARSTLNNARRVREYLEPAGPGRYVLSGRGREFVMELLRKEAAK